MKIRTLTLGISLSPEDFLLVLAPGQEQQYNHALFEKIRLPWQKLLQLKNKYEEFGYQVQTTRLSFNSFEEWLIPCIIHSSKDEELIVLQRILNQLNNLLEEFDIPLCSVGPCKNLSNAPLIPVILRESPRMHASVLFDYNGSDVAPNYCDCLESAKVCLSIATELGNLANFRFCVGFNCPPNTPFYPISYHRTGDPPSLSIGLENGDLIFLSFFGANGDPNQAKENLVNTLRQALLPIQKIAQEELNNNTINNNERLSFAGIDASINPGLSLPDSVGNGIEQFLRDLTGKPTTEPVPYCPLSRPSRPSRPLLRPFPLPILLLLLITKTHHPQLFSSRPAATPV
jgi:uncharacterized protein (UPF0210 family)